jgi:hypothetical protein
MPFCRSSPLGHQSFAVFVQVTAFARAAQKVWSGPFWSRDGRPGHLVWRSLSGPKGRWTGLAERPCQLVAVPDAVALTCGAFHSMRSACESPGRGFRPQGVAAGRCGSSGSTHTSVVLGSWRDGANPVSVRYSRGSGCDHRSARPGCRGDLWAAGVVVPVVERAGKASVPAGKASIPPSQMVRGSGGAGEHLATGATFPPPPCWSGCGGTVGPTSGTSRRFTGEVDLTDYSIAAVDSDIGHVDHETPRCPAGAAARCGPALFWRTSMCVPGLGYVEPTWGR